MIERWQQLTVKEKQTLFWALIIVGILVSYFLLFRPLQHGIATMKQEIPEQQSLVVWMEGATKQIINLRSKQTKKTETTELALLPTIEQSLKSINLNKEVAELSQTEGNKVKVTFKQVAFDRLILWLDDLWRKYSIEAEEITITPSKPTGTVEAILIISTKK